MRLSRQSFQLALLLSRKIGFEFGELQKLRVAAVKSGDRGEAVITACSKYVYTKNFTKNSSLMLPGLVLTFIDELSFRAQIRIFLIGGALRG